MDEEKYLRQVRLHKFINDRSVAEESIGVCLWGPPGCGKSSALSHIKELLDDTDILFFNVDDFVLYMAKEFIFDTYKTIISMPVDERTANRENESLIRNNLASSTYTTLMQMKEDGSKQPKSLFEVIENYFVKGFEQALTEDEWVEFNATSNNDSMTNAPIVSIFMNFGPWWAKRNKKHFVVEMTGRNWDLARHERDMGRVKNLMYIPFVADVRILTQRVAARAQQFGNATEEIVRNIFGDSYGNKLIDAIKSGIYKQIIVQGNNKLNYVMISLERLTNEADGTHSYMLVKENANDVAEAMYIKAFLLALLVPEHMHTKFNLRYDVVRNQWATVA